MLAINRVALLRQQLVHSTRRTLSAKPLPATSAAESEEYTETPNYPEILDNSIESRKIREQSAWHEKIQDLNTVEEKLIKINMPRYYGYKSVMLSDKKYPYNCLPMTQHYTRTAFETIEQLPAAYQENQAKVEELAKSVQAEVEEALECSNEYLNYKDTSGVSPHQKEAIFGQIAVEQINRTLLNSLSAEFPHLSEVETDLNPRHEAFWFAGGVDPPKIVRKSKEAHPWQKEKANEPVDRAVQYIGEPLLAVRHRLPLKEIVNQEETSVSVASKVPSFKYDSRVLGYDCAYRHGTTIPGYWPGSPSEFGLISYQNRNHLLQRDAGYGEQDTKEALIAQAIQSSFAWTLGQASYQGFSTFNELTYPIGTQTVITNGKDWSFFVYQLNTTLIHSYHVRENPKANLCWGTNEMKLFEEFGANGKIVGFNENVLKSLLHFYANAPAERGVNLKPYLGEDERKISDINDMERREFLERTFKHMVSNRPRHLELPEIYAWEKIYKIDNKTRSLEPRRRFFEIDVNPWKRTMDQHTPEYIPRCVRAEGPKSKKKWKKTYYP